MSEAPAGSVAMTVRVCCPSVNSKKLIIITGNVAPAQGVMTTVHYPPYIRGTIITYRLQSLHHQLNKYE